MNLRVHSSIKSANSADAMLSTRLISHITLTIIIDVEGGGDGFCEICCPISGDKNLKLSIINGAKVGMATRFF